MTARSDARLAARRGNLHRPWQPRRRLFSAARWQVRRLRSGTIAVVRLRGLVYVLEHARPGELTAAVDRARARQGRRWRSSLVERWDLQTRSRP